MAIFLPSCQLVQESRSAHKSALCASRLLIQSKPIPRITVQILTRNQGQNLIIGTAVKTSTKLLTRTSTKRNQLNQNQALFSTNLMKIHNLFAVLRCSLKSVHFLQNKNVFLISGMQPPGPRDENDIAPTQRKTREIIKLNPRFIDRVELVPYLPRRTSALSTVKNKCLVDRVECWISRLWCEKCLEQT